MTLTQILVLAAAPFVGSFLGVLVTRLPAGEPVVHGRSRCATCRETLGMRDMIPIVSWLALKGRCRHCGACIPADLLLIEITALAVALWAVTSVPDTVVLSSCVLGWGLLALGWIDARTFTLPHVLTLPLAALGLGVSAWFSQDVPWQSLAGAGAGFAAFWLIAELFRRWRGRDGLGMGDAFLLAVGGAWTGLAGLPTIILYGAAGGLAWVGIQYMTGRTGVLHDRLPFGPFLAAGIWLVWLYGPVLLR